MTVQQAHQIINGIEFWVENRYYRFNNNGTFVVSEGENQTNGTYSIYEDNNEQCFLRTRPQIFDNDLLISIRLTNEEKGGFFDIF